jgi:DNA-binding transcriptional LysR family regulator
VLSVAQAGVSDMQQIVEAGGDGTVRIGLVPSVSSLLFPLLPQVLAQAFPRLRVEFHDQTNDALVRELQSGQIDFGIGAIDSSLPAELLVYPLREDPFVAVLHRDDPLAAQPHLPWKLLAGRDIAVFSKGNIQRLVGALAESHRLTLNTRYQVDYIETLVWPGALASGDCDSARAVYHPSAGPGAERSRSSSSRRWRGPWP